MNEENVHINLVSYNINIKTLFYSEITVILFSCDRHRHYPGKYIKHIA